MEEALPLDKCCDLGKNWAEEGLKCERFSGPVPGIPQDEQELCLQGVNICCIRAYHEKSCLEGKEDARSGKGCSQGASSNQRKLPIGMGDYRKDCCEGCKLGEFIKFNLFLDNKEFKEIYFPLELSVWDF